MKRGLKAIDLASRAGISQSYISEMEGGKRPITDEIGDRIAAAFRISATDLEAEIAALAPPVPSAVGSAYRVAEDPADYLTKARATVLPNETRSPFELLSRQLIADLPRDKAFDLVRELTNEAEKGDSTAAGRAQALLYILTTP